MTKKNAQDALWRASKRIGAAWRWLKLDLSLLGRAINTKMRGYSRNRKGYKRIHQPPKGNVLSYRRVVPNDTQQVCMFKLFQLCCMELLCNHAPLWHKQFTLQLTFMSDRCQASTKHTNQKCQIKRRDFCQVSAARTQIKRRAWLVTTPYS